MGYLKARWALLCIMALFIAAKIPHLFYPYYWDESWSYLPAIRAMRQHGVGLLPGTLAPELSRGHPLLFYAMAAGWMSVFGSSPVATHSFALVISAALLVLVYEAAIRLFNSRVAVLATLFTALQVVFFVQAAFVLPEVLVITATRVWVHSK